MARTLPLAILAPSPVRRVLALPWRVAAALLIAAAVTPMQPAAADGPSLAAHLLAGITLAVAVACIIEASNAAMALVERSWTPPPAEGALAKLQPWLLVVLLAGSGGLETIVTALARSHELAMPAIDGPLHLMAGFFSLALRLAMPLLAAQLVLDALLAAVTRGADGLVDAPGRAGIRSLASVALACVLMVAILGVAMDRFNAMGL